MSKIFPGRLSWQVKDPLTERDKEINAQVSWFLQGRISREVGNAFEVKHVILATRRRVFYNIRGGY